MPTSIAKIKQTLKNHKDEIIVFGAFSAVATIGALSTYYAIKREMRDDVIVPKKLIDYMIKTGEFVGTDLPNGFTFVGKIISTENLK